MFHSSGYFKKTLCPFHEHGLCHRPHCHYSHKLPRPQPPAKSKRPSFLKEQPPSVESAPSTVLNFDISKIDDKVMSDVAMAMGHAANFFGSSSVSPVPNKEETKEETEVPLYAPEKCMSAVLYSPPTNQASNEKPPSTVDYSSVLSYQSPFVKDKLDPPVDTTRESSNSREGDSIGPSLVDSSRELTEADVFGSPVDDDIPGVGSEVTMDTGDSPSMLLLEAEFNKVTALPTLAIKTKDPVPLKRKAEDDPYGSSLTKKWKAHADSQVVREATRVTPRPSTIRSNFSDMLSGTPLYMGKQRTAINKEPKTNVSRPKLPLTVNARIPTSVRQRFLNAFIDEQLKMTSDPQLAYTTSLDEERALFEKSTKRMIYMNYVTSALKKLREKSQAFLQEQRSKSDARVKKHAQQIKTTPSSDKYSKDIPINTETKHSNINKEKKVLKVKDKISDKGKKKDWKEIEAELQDSFFTEEMKSFSKQFDEKASSKKAPTKPAAIVSSSASKFYSKPPPISSSVKPPKKAAVNLEVDLFGESSSDDETTPIATPPTSAVSDDSEPGLSFESALSKKSKFKKIPRRSIKRKNSTGSQVEAGKKERRTSSTSSMETRTKRVSRNSSHNGSSKGARVKRKSSVTMSKTPVLNLSRVLSISSDSGSPDHTKHKPPPIHDAVLTKHKPPPIHDAVLTKHKPPPIHDAVLTKHKPPPIHDVVLTKHKPPLSLIDDAVLTKHKPPLSLIDDAVLTKHKPPLSLIDDAVFDEIQPEEQVCHTVTSLSPPLSPLFAPSGPYINLTKLATAKKPPPDIASIARAMGKRPVVPRKAMPTRTGSVTVVKKKEIPFTPAVFYQYMTRYLLSEEQLTDNGYPRPTQEVGVVSINRGDARPPIIERVGENAKRHLCCRCGKPFVIYNDGKYQTVVECSYHYGRLIKRKEYGEGMISAYTCCQGRRDSDACQLAKLHVTAGELPSRESGYVTTATGSLGNPCVYAVDCEMCYTTAGLQLTRVSVVNLDLQVVYESLVVPSHPIVDYNTRFSGLKAEDFVSVTTTLSDVQVQLLSLVGGDTILVGHSLESDLRSLKVMHDRVVDTALVFPHKKGLPYKRSLKALMTEHLMKFIQNDIDGGHDSLEDSRSCMELMVWKVKGDLKRDARRTSNS